MDKKTYNEVCRLTGEAKRKISEVMRRERIGYNERDALASAVTNISAVENFVANAISKEPKIEPE